MKNSTSTYLFDEVNIVVYDKHTEHSNQLVEATDTDNTPSDHAFSLILLAKLAQKFNSVSFLSGGFVDFKDTFKHLWVNKDDRRYLAGTVTFKGQAGVFAYRSLLFGVIPAHSCGAELAPG